MEISFWSETTHQSSIVSTLSMSVLSQTWLKYFFWSQTGEHQNSLLQLPGIRSRKFGGKRLPDFSKWGSLTFQWNTKQGRGKQHSAIASYTSWELQCHFHICSIILFSRSHRSWQLLPGNIFWLLQTPRCQQARSYKQFKQTKWCHKDNNLEDWRPYS